MSGARKKVCFVVASEITVTAFLIDQVRRAATQYAVTVALDTADTGFLAARGIDAQVVSIAIKRKISPRADAAALAALVRLFRARRFDIVHSVSPKAGLLATLAGFIARVPRRVHTFTGQVWVTRTGTGRLLLKQADKLIAALATHVLVDSPSQRAFLVEQRVVSADKALVLAEGSISGVDTIRFSPDAAARAEIRSALAIPAGATVFLYLGRLNRDKGLLDLARAFALLSREQPEAWLVLVGPDEERLLPQIGELIGAGADRLVIVGYTAEPERYMAAADVFCLPSYREGFGTVAIEAAACGVPAIASRIYGISDAVVDGETGVLHAAGDTAALAGAMRALAADPQLRGRLAAAGLARARAVFGMARLTSALMTFYEKILN